MAITTSATVRGKQAFVTTTNGTEKVSVRAVDGVKGEELSVLTLNEQEAVDLAIALLCHAQQVREGIHDNQADKPVASAERAIEAINWEPPVTLPTEPGFYAHRAPFESNIASTTILFFDGETWVFRTGSLDREDALACVTSWAEGGFLVKLAAVTA